ncbi:MAG: serine/threonine protein kinase, partial [Acidobacteria bacterium]|nr:serine/threonine protein kinase [Acidobacteriota bacterium]
MEPSPRLEAFRQLFFQRLTRYEYRGVLGQGGMGVVFAAYDRDLDTELAIKVPTPSFEEKAPGVLARFKRELLLSRKIKHPNVARLYDFGDCEGCPYVTMELIPGVSLRTLMEREPEMPVSRVLFLFRQITKGCGAAHAEGITHRDLKPENVMVGEGDTVSILDFGLARSEKSPNLTRHGEVLGTPNYMAPEVLRGGRALPSADVYSIGVML